MLFSIFMVQNNEYPQTSCLSDKKKTLKTLMSYYYGPKTILVDTPS